MFYALNIKIIKNKKQKKFFFYSFFSFFYFYYKIKFSNFLKRFQISVINLQLFIYLFLSKFLII